MLLCTYGGPVLYIGGGELVFYAIFQPLSVIYGSQFPQPEKLIVPGSELATYQLTNTSVETGEYSSLKARQLYYSATEAPRQQAC